MAYRTRLGIPLSCLLLGACGSPGDDDVPAIRNEHGLQPSLMRMDQIGIEGGRGLFVAKRDQGETRIAFDIPVERLAPERRHDMEQVGETDDGIVVVLDRYASQGPSDGRCRDGQEVFLRVFSLPKRSEVFVRSVASCLMRVDTVPVTWLGDRRFWIGTAIFSFTNDAHLVAENGRG